MMKPGRVKVITPALKPDSLSGRKFYIESYGCAMNFADSEVVAAILQDCGFYRNKGLHKSRPGTDQYLFYPGKSRANRSQPFAHISTGKEIKAFDADCRIGLYGRTAEIEIPG